MKTKTRRVATIAATAALALAATTAAGAGDVAAGKEKSAQCAQCHGPDGNSPTPAFPVIAGQYADYLVQALREYKTGARQNAIMAGFAAGLSEEDMEDLAAYFSVQEGKLFTIRYAD